MFKTSKNTLLILSFLAILASCKHISKENKIPEFPNASEFINQKSQQKEPFNPKWDTVIVNQENLFIYQYGYSSYFILNSQNDTIHNFSEGVSDIEFVDFNKNGYKDFLVHYFSNTPYVNDLALFDEVSNTFVLVDNFTFFPASQKIKGTKYYYSYHRSGCADYNWDSDLFYIENYEAIRTGNISGRGCEREEETGIFVSKVKEDEKTLIESFPREPGYHHDKWDFIEEYWTKNYKRFQ